LGTKLIQDDYFGDKRLFRDSKVIVCKKKLLWKL